MSSTLTIARPYARAAFETARAHTSLGDWAQRLAFAAQVAVEPQVTALFGNPQVSSDELASLFLADGEPLDSSFTRFVHLLAENDRLRELPEITALFEELKRSSERVIKVRVRTAAPIDETEKAKLSAALKQRFGSEIEMELVVDAQILGGAIIDAGDVVIDGSVRGKLARLEQVLTH
ncbi:MAG: F0F1 ATP synthase subunit delta [Dokdonella sp.]